MKIYDRCVLALLMAFCGFFGLLVAPAIAIVGLLIVSALSGGVVLIAVGLALRWWLFGQYEPDWIFPSEGLPVMAPGIAPEASGAVQAAAGVGGVLLAAAEPDGAVLVLLAAAEGARPEWAYGAEVVQTAANALVDADEYDVIVRGESGVPWLEGRRFSKEEAKALAKSLVADGWDTVSVTPSPRRQRVKPRARRGAR